MKRNGILKTMAMIIIAAFALTWQMSAQTATSRTTMLISAQIAAKQAQLAVDIQKLMPPPVLPTTLKKMRAMNASLALASPMTDGMSPMDSPQTPVGQNYVVVDMGTLGGSVSYAYGINSSAQIIGYADVSSISHAFLYSNGSMQNLGTLSGDGSSLAHGINNNGQVVGLSQNLNTFISHAFLYQNGAMQVLSPLPGGSRNEAFGINSSGQIVGWSDTGDGSQHAFLYSNGSMQNLGALGGPYSEALAINDNGQVAGWAYTTNFSERAFLYSNGSMRNLGTLGGNFSEAYGINLGGQVVGDSYIANGNDHAFLYSGGVMQDLGTLGGNSSVAYGINDSGQAVGYSFLSGNSIQHAFLYSGGVLQDLNSLTVLSPGWTLQRANAINNNGQIVGYGINPSGRTHAFLLSPVTLQVTQVISNEVPAQPIYGDLTKQPGKDSLVVITHGWINPFESINAETSWVDSMSNSITQYLVTYNLTDWQVAGYKWTVNASTLTPDMALHNANQEGIALGNIISSQGWGHVHLIAHSAGSELISTAAQWIKVFSPSTVVQCTFLDAYVGLNYAGVSNYGAGTTDWSDSYFSRDLLTSPGGEAHPLTEGPLNNAFNVDVTQLDPTKIVYNEFSSSGSLGSCYTTKSTHGWPIDFYENSITSPSGYAGYGFPLSIEGGNYGQGQYSKGNTPPVILGTPDPVCDGNYTDSTTPAYIGPVINFSGLPKQQSGTGVIVVNGVRFSLTTDSPAWLASFITLANPANLVSFDAEFTSAVGAQGMLSVYWDTNLVGSVDERVAIPGLNHYTFSFPSAMDNGVHMLGFRLDPFTNISSTISITNVVTGYVGVSQPFSLSVTTNKVAGLPVLQLAGQSGFNYTVQASTNLASTNWLNIAVLANTNGAVQFIDPDSVNYAMRFYRAVAPQ